MGNPDFAIEREIRKRISPPRNPSSGWISIKKSKSGFHGFPFYCSMGKSEKRFAELFSWTVVFFLLIMRARARPLFLRTIFKSFFGFPKKKKKKKDNGKEGNPRTDISALKSVSDFAFDYKSEIRILNLSTKYKFITLPWTRRISRLYFRRSLGSGFVFPRVGGLKSVGIVVIEPQPTFLIDCSDSDFTSHRLR